MARHLTQRPAHPLPPAPVAFEDKLERLVRSCASLVVLATREEKRAARAVKTVCEHLRRPGVIFDIAEGFSALVDGNGSLPTAKEPLAALDQIDKAAGEALYVLRDAHDWVGNPQLKRKLRSVAQRLTYSRKRIIITCPSTDKLPEELKDAATVLEVPLPTPSEFSAVLDHLALSPGVTVALSAEGRARLLQAAVGLTESQALQVFADVLVQRGLLDDRAIAVVTRERARIIAQSTVVELCPTIETPDRVGGLGALKHWVRLRMAAFTEEGRRYGLPPPKGVLLLGIPGTGKSLAAKMIAGLWELPLLRLDLGALFRSLVGESEATTRQALCQAAALAPAVLWIDELDKGLAHAGIDGGTSRRVVGTILTWMAEKTAPVFVVATANDISSLPPELMRKGRFDEVFFLDLPSVAERIEIFSVHLTQCGRSPDDYDLDSVALGAEGYVGAEIEQAVTEAMHEAFNDDAREFTTGDILLALQRQVPLSRSHTEAIEKLRQWLHEGRARAASFPEPRSNGQAPPTIPLEPM